MTLDHDLLAFIVSSEKSGVILTGLSLYVTWPFSFAALNILYSVCKEAFFWNQSIWGSVSFLYLHGHIFRLGKLSMILLNILSVFLS